MLAVNALVDRRTFIAALGGVALAGAGVGDALAGEPPAGAAPRAGFKLTEGLVYLNNGSLGPCPSEVVKATIDAWRQLELDPVTQGYGPLLNAMNEARARAAKFVGCATDELAVTENTTQGMNAVAQGLDLQEGDRVLTTDHEHPGGSICWEYFAKRTGVVIDKIELPVPPRSADEILKLLAEKMTTATRVISVSHVTYTTGRRMPIARIGELARTQGALLVVDGAQAPGVLDVDLATLNCDAYATSAHKWLLAPRGTGLLYIRKEAQEKIAPMLLSHGFSAYTAATGTRNIPGIIGLGAAVDYIDKIGKRAVEKHALSLAALARDRLSPLRGVGMLSPPPGELGSALLTFSLPDGVNPHGLAETLRTKHKIVVRPVTGHNVNGIRLSFHVYNSEADVGRLLDAVQQELKV